MPIINMLAISALLKCIVCIDESSMSFICIIREDLLYLPCLLYHQNSSQYCALRETSPPSWNCEAPLSCQHYKNPVQDGSTQHGQNGVFYSYSLNLPLDPNFFFPKWLVNSGKKTMRWEEYLPIKFECTTVQFFKEIGQEWHKDVHNIIPFPLRLVKDVYFPAEAPVTEFGICKVH